MQLRRARGGSLCEGASCNSFRSLRRGMVRRRPGPLMPFSSSANAS